MTLSTTTNGAQMSCEALTVLFDGACPLCRREVGVYQALKPAQPVAWLDVSKASVPLTLEDRARYLARFHVRREDGSLLSGAAAFVALWRVMPGWRWLARLAMLPGATPVLERLYRGFLRVRPGIQRLARACDTSHLPAGLVADLRSDHAGETGAVWIYRGMLCVTRDETVRKFARQHLDTELQHLQTMSALLPPLRRSWLLVAWRVAGFATGALPAVFGRRAVFATVAAVETFVVQHYAHQIEALTAQAGQAALRQVLVDCQRDEAAHRIEAQAHLAHPPGAFLAGWCTAVGRGSALAVTLARRV
ncbi:demethoxyubiquinone hydroxylase family protein [Polaromonas sp. CG_9.11]|uniref:demethoxyubiquinone hydroxylase family protein n=1 Tax=Polaromonas sp. CG_9.11 TaxID=2787730 RepID=UPI0009DD2BC3|nr:demethoxyubiquinone hydroxylase family protein [Polaromonas sp. CG_9.11]MBG6077336.1 demethoxyubiquinone hydroxylase (CLK1/Coq7/Cat5 family) [Polaromonas sp. CG_9.11]